MHKHSINLDDKVNTIVLNFWVKAEPELINFTSHNVETPMIEKINQAKKQLNFNNKQLSEALGYSRQYITKMLNLPQSEKIQNKVENEIHALLSREKFNPLSILSKPSEQRLDKLKNLSNVAINAVEIRRLQEIAPIKAMYYDVDGVFYYKDGWFLYTWNGFDWDIISMDTDTSNLYELWENESDQ